MLVMPLESLLQGHISCERGDGWIKPWRLPFNRLRLFPPEDGIVIRAEDAAGVRLRLATDSPCLELLVGPSGERRLFDLTVGGALLQTVPLEPGETIVRFDDLPGGDGPLELWLPQTHPVTLRELRIAKGSSLDAPPDPRPRWVAYGSSITQCRTAHSPARTWPAIVARERGLHLTCLGYGGNCHIEPTMARLIRDLDADVITLELGINVQGSASLSGRTLCPAIIGMVQIIRESHPSVPIGIISPIISPPREDAPNAVGMSLGMLRAHVRDAVRRLVEAGDGNLHYFDGKELFGHDVVQYLPDMLHPDGDGYEVLGRRISERVFGSGPFAHVKGRV